MTTWAQREYTDVAELRGPLLFVRGVTEVGWDEFAMIRTAAGVRHGLVLETDRDLAVVQVFEGTGGLAAATTRVAFSGSPLRIPVGPGWLGRVCSGRGEPVDGGPPVTGEVTMPVTGTPLNPVLREPPSEPVLTGISVIDALTTLVRGRSCRCFLWRACRTWSWLRSWPRRHQRAGNRSAWCSRLWGSPTPMPVRSAPS